MRYDENNKTLQTIIKYTADVAELADAHDLGSCSVRSGGSSPLIRTNIDVGFRLMAKTSVGNLLVRTSLEPSPSI